MAIGGGHGLAASLRAVRRYASEVTAVVSVADDGGSTGRLRAAGERPAPGDLRKCLVALAERDSTLADAMEYRFGDGELEGHAFGNLLIVAMAERGGDLVGALDEIGRLIGASGRVLPATVHPVRLAAAVASGARVAGQVAISDRADVWTVALEPDAPACPDAVAAIEDRRSDRPGPRVAVHERPRRGGGAGDPRGGRRRPTLPSCTSATCARSPARPPATASPSTSKRSNATASSPDVVLHDPATMGDADVPARAVGAAVARPPHLVHDPELLAAALAALASS